MEQGALGDFQRERTAARNPFPEKLCCSCRRVLAVLVAYCPQDSQLQGQVVPGGLAGVPLPGSSRSASVPGYQTVLPASPFMKKTVPGCASGVVAKLL